MKKHGILFCLIALYLAASCILPDSSASETFPSDEKIKESLKKSEAAYFNSLEILDSISIGVRGDAALVRKAYKIILKREPSGAELSSWIERIGRGVSKLSMIEFLTSQDEYFLIHDVWGYVKSPYARLMQGPGFDDTSIMTMKKGVTFKILSKIGEWYNIKQNDGKNGFIRSECIGFNVTGIEASAEEPDLGTNETEISDFKRIFEQDIKSLTKTFEELKKALVISPKYNFYEIKKGMLINGENLLTEYRKKTLAFSEKSESFNSRSPFKIRMMKFDASYNDLLDYTLVKKIMGLQIENINVAAVEVLRNGESIIPSAIFPAPAHGASKALLENLKQECNYRKIKLYAVVDILNLGKGHFQQSNELFMKNAFGQYSNVIEKDRYFADFTSEEARRIMFSYLDEIIKTGYFDAIVINNLKLPEHPASGNDIRSIFIFNDGPIREFEKNTGISFASLSENHDMIFKKFAIAKFENFVFALRKYFTAKKLPFYAVCDADYYLKKFDTRLCEFKIWGNNIDLLFLRFKKNDAGSISKTSQEISSALSRPQIVTLPFDEVKSPSELADSLKSMCIENNLARGYFICD